jgi:leader peptidase (prepilin peptidase)/N-methyltransferase
MQIIDILKHEPVLFYLSVFIFSLLIGSFLNVVIHRVPIMLHRRFKAECINYFTEHHPALLHQDAVAKEIAQTSAYNLVVPRSACPHCGHKITALENIPVISYLWLRGRCRGCQAPISLRYPLVEALTALLAVVVAWKFGVTLAMLMAVVLTYALISLTFIDLDTQYLPDEITLPLLWLGLILNFNQLFTDFTSAFWGAVAGYLVLWVVYQVFKLITHREGMGFGDFKLLALLGAWLGWQVLPAIVIISSLIGSVVGISMILFLQHDRRIPIPFGPYLAGAGWVVLIWGREINQFYYHNFLGM